MTHNHDVAFFTTYFTFRPIWGQEKVNLFLTPPRQYILRTKKDDWPIWVQEKVPQCYNKALAIIPGIIYDIKDTKEVRVIKLRKFSTANFIFNSAPRS